MMARTFSRFLVSIFDFSSKLEIHGELYRLFPVDIGQVKVADVVGVVAELSEDAGKRILVARDAGAGDVADVVDINRLDGDRAFIGKGVGDVFEDAQHTE